MRRIISGMGCALALLIACKTTLSAGPGADSTGTEVSFDPSGNDASLYVWEALAPPTPSAGTCVYGAQDAVSMAAGWVDVSFANVATYTPTFVLGNSSGSAVVVRGATTAVTDLNGADLLSMLATMCAAHDEAACRTGQQIVDSATLATPVDPFTTAETTALDGGSASAPSYASMATTIVDGSTVAIMRAYFTSLLAMSGPGAALSTSIQLLTYTKVQGTTLAGDDVESDAFEFPVTFTFGSLVANLQNDGGDASIACVDTTVAPSSDPTCVPGQDVPSAVASVAGLPACSALTDGGSSDASVEDGGLGDASVENASSSDAAVHE